MNERRTQDVDQQPVRVCGAGSCMYLENGSEENNYFERNLVAFVHVLGTPAAGAVQASRHLFLSTWPALRCCLKHAPSS